MLTRSAPSTRVDCGCSTIMAREKGAEHGDYRRTLSPQLSANGFFRPGNRGVPRTATESQRARGREVPAGPEAARSQRARGDRGHWVGTLVRAVTRGAGYRGVD